MDTPEKSIRTCHCDWLKNAANDERFPVEYDRQNNTFKLQCQLGEGQLGYAVLHYCPFCGGRAPDIRKEKTFTHISEQEHQRLQQLTQQIKSIEDAFRILGEPQMMDPPSFLETRLSQAENDMLRAARSLTYQNVSETAIVHITEYEQGNISIVFQEKYLGERV
jgi:hypothetical protein